MAFNNNIASVQLAEVPDAVTVSGNEEEEEEE